MTLSEIKIALSKGKRVIHRFFVDTEWIMQENDMIITEDGSKIKQSVFWNSRTSDFWQKDWSIIS